MIVARQSINTGVFSYMFYPIWAVIIVVDLSRQSNQKSSGFLIETINHWTSLGESKKVKLDIEIYIINFLMDSKSSLNLYLIYLTINLNLI